MARASREPRRQADIDKVAAMAHPARRRIHELLVVEGPATVGALAKQTGERVGSVSHHLKMLAKVGLIEEAPERARDRRESWWKPVKASWSWSITDFEEDPAGEVIAEAAEREQLRASVERTQQWFANRHECGREWIDAAFSSTSWLKLTAPELAELSRRLTDVVVDFAAETPNGDEGEDGSESHATGEDERRPVYVFTYAIPARP